MIGSEQGKSRPVIILSEDEINKLLNAINVIPITSRKPERIIYPNEYLLPKGSVGLPNESIALCHQIRTIDKRRLSNRYGVISGKDLQNGIIEAICFQLGIEYDNV